MLFSILIANYNNGHFFKECYSSILSQTYKDWEVVIVDDGSTDNSIELIELMISGDKRFNFFRNTKNKGCGFTKNRCAKLSSGVILGYLDPDDALVPEALELMIKAHTNHKDAALITSNYELVDLQMNSIREGTHAGPVPSNKSFLTFGKGALTAFATFKRKYYLRTEGLDPLMKRAVDQDLYYKLEEQGEVIFLNKILYRYRVHKNSISHNENLYKALYWHYYTKRKAFLRRKAKSLKINNYSSSQFKNISSDFFLGRFERLKFTGKRKAKYYFIFKSIIANPFHKPVRKIKSFILLLLGKL